MRDSIRFLPKASDMLDLNDPLTSHVFAAARQLDLIRDYVNRMSCADSESRRFMLEVIRPCFVAVRAIQIDHFADRPQISEAIDALELRVEELAQRSVRPADGSPDRPSRCPCCQQPLATWSNGKGRRCAACTEAAMKALETLESLDAGFGTEAI